jgi:hypothetical protein
MGYAQVKEKGKKNTCLCSIVSDVYVLLLFVLEDFLFESLSEFASSSWASSSSEAGRLSDSLSESGDSRVLGVVEVVVVVVC